MKNMMKPARWEWTGAAISLKSVFASRARNWILLGLAALAATRFYYVREVIAELAICFVLFAVVAGAVLALFLLARAGLRMLAWAGHQTSRA